jgi:hypothetical protein
MNEDRKRILDLLADGKINADEAERLIAALAATGQTGPRRRRRRAGRRSTFAWSSTPAAATARGRPR